MLLIYSAHISICALVILVILFQDGKTGGLTGVADNASQQVFGAKGAGSFLTKLTTGLAIAFMFTSLTLAIFHKSDDSSIADDYKPEVSNTESSSVETPGDTAVPEVKSTETGDIIITNEDGTKRSATLGESVKSMEIVDFKDAPKEIQEMHRLNREDVKKKNEMANAKKGLETETDKKQD